MKKELQALMKKLEKKHLKIKKPPPPPPPKPSIKRKVVLWRPAEIRGYEGQKVLIDKDYDS